MDLCLILCELIKGKVDIFQINKTKLKLFPSDTFVMSDYKFTSNQFIVSGYEFIIKDFRVELLFILMINCQTKKIEKSSYIDILTIEIAIRKNKDLVAGIYKPPTLSENDFATSLEIIISRLLNKCQN